MRYILILLALVALPLNAATLSWTPYSDNVSSFDASGYEIHAECTQNSTTYKNMGKTSATNNSMKITLLAGDQGKCRIAALRLSDDQMSQPTEAVAYDFPFANPTTPSGLTISFD